MINNNEIKTTTDDLENSQLSNIGDHIFKSDNSKLLQLTENMIKNNVVKTTLEFAKKFMFTFDSKDQFPININTLIEMKVYDLVGNIKKKLIKNFILDTDYQVIKAACESSQAAFIKKGGSGKNKENIMLTVDCFKSMCMLANSVIGKQVKIYYLDLEKIFKQYIILELKEKDLQLTQSEKDKDKYLSLYNTQVQKHRFHKFNVSGPCFYIITQGLDYADGIARIKIGICGCIKRKINKCPHCEGVLEDTKKNKSFDWRLGDHRTLWPQLQVKFAVYTEDAELLERNMKRLYRTQINPNGHEIIEGVRLDEVVDQTKSFLKLFNYYSGEKQEYMIEDNIEKYNKNSLTHMKKCIKHMIEEKEDMIDILTELTEKVEDDINTLDDRIDKVEDRVHIIEEKQITNHIELLEEIEKYTDKKLKELLVQFKLPVSGVKDVKKDRIRVYLENNNTHFRECDTCCINKSLNTDNYRVFGYGYKKRCIECDLKSCEIDMELREEVKTEITEDIETAVCSKCKKTLAVDDFHKNKANKSGRESQCKNCRAVNKNLKRNDGVLKPMRKINNTVECGDNEKLCSDCNTVKDKCEFRKSTVRKDGCQSYCKLCDNARLRKNRMKRKII
jgi:hypothetical protein